MPTYVSPAGTGAAGRLIVLTGHSGRAQPVPDGRQRGGADAVVQPVGLRAVQVDPVGEGRAEGGGVVVVAGGPGRCSVAEERQVGLAVVADGELVVDLQPAVAGAVVVLRPGAVVRVVRVGMAAAL